MEHNLRTRRKVTEGGGNWEVGQGPILEGLQGPVEQFGPDPGGNKKSIQVTEQVMFAKEFIWLKCAKQIEGRKSLETGRPV